jgi:Tol biopolymer transport system component
VFQRSSSGDVDVFIMKSDGTRKRNLTPASIGSDGSPAFSADGRKIVYLHNGLITINSVDVKGRRKLNVRGRDPAFSPNGRHILFVRERRGIFLMRVDGGGVRKLWSTHAHGGELVESPADRPRRIEPAGSPAADGSKACLLAEWSEDCVYGKRRLNGPIRLLWRTPF